MAADNSEYEIWKNIFNIWVSEFLDSKKQSSLIDLNVRNDIISFINGRIDTKISRNLEKKIKYHDYRTLKFPIDNNLEEALFAKLKNIKVMLIVSIFNITAFHM